MYCVLFGLILLPLTTNAIDNFSHNLNFQNSSTIALSDLDEQKSDCSYQIESEFIGPVFSEVSQEMYASSCYTCYLAYVACMATAIDGSSCQYLYEACRLLYC